MIFVYLFQYDLMLKMHIYIDIYMYKIEIYKIFILLHNMMVSSDKIYARSTTKRVTIIIKQLKQPSTKITYLMSFLFLHNYN